MGEEVLEGLKGIAMFDNDFRDSEEMHTVWYDPAVISVEEMEQALKDAGLYLRTLR